MTDPRTDRLAALLTEYSCEVQPGDYVAIYGSPSGEP